MKKNIFLIISVILLTHFTGCQKEVTEDSYSIVYSTAHGITPKSKIVEPDYVITEEDLPELTETGYEFWGWDKFSGDVVTQDITITASWNKLVFYTVTYSTEYGEEPKSFLVPEDYKLTKEDLPALQDNSHTFVGWDLPEGYVVRDDITITASWKELTYNTITYSTAHGKNVKERKVTQGYEITAEDLPELSELGYVFGGWDVKTGTKVMEDITITAIWAVGTGTDYTIEYYLQTLDLLSYELKEAEAKKGITNATSNVIPKAYTGFAPLEIEQQVISADGKTIVKVYYDRKVITLTVNLDGGTSASLLQSNKLTGVYGAPVSFEPPVKSGFELMGWNTSLEDFPSTFPEDSMIYTAMWDDVPPPDVTNVGFSIKDNSFIISWKNPVVDDIDKVIISNKVLGKEYEVYCASGKDSQRIIYFEESALLCPFKLVCCDINGNKSSGAYAGIIVGETNQKVGDLLTGKMYEVDNSSKEVVIIPNNCIETIECGEDAGKSHFFKKDRKFKISSYTLGQNEVTKQLYKTVMQDNSLGLSNVPCGEDNLSNPVTNISWYEAVYFCNMLSVKCGLEPYYEITNIQMCPLKSHKLLAADIEISKKKNAHYGYRLPTELEWELAAREVIPYGTKWKEEKNASSVTSLPINKLYDADLEYCFDTFFYETMSYDYKIKTNAIYFDESLINGYFVDPVASLSANYNPSKYKVVRGESENKRNYFIINYLGDDVYSADTTHSFRVARYQEED